MFSGEVGRSRPTTTACVAGNAAEQVVTSRHLDHAQRGEVGRKIGARVGEEKVVDGDRGTWTRPSAARNRQFGAMAERFLIGASQAEAVVGGAVGGSVHGK